MKVFVTNYLGWDVWKELETGERFARVRTWTASKGSETVILEAPTYDTLRELINMREAQHE